MFAAQVAHLSHAYAMLSRAGPAHVYRPLDEPLVQAVTPRPVLRDGPDPPDRACESCHRRRGRRACRSTATRPGRASIRRCSRRAARWERTRRLSMPWRRDGAPARHSTSRDAPAIAGRDLRSGSPTRIRSPSCRPPVPARSRPGRRLPFRCGRGTRRRASAASGIQFREPVDSIHLDFVRQFDPRDGNAQLNRRDHRPTASSIVGKLQTAAATASGSGCSRTVISLMTPSVPSEPTNNRVRS